ncbi:hypothetical protein TOPH_03041 [Tolypocladium ophioglossoides CBS 100239]|uniref:Uncharacterized protein n=1 Tax=Tolypocladium ophioglossoides (strain CBS 100239) TaxID=1163406 RepID=A0A0L0NEA9_TOLOC|nr:hypothetical protein TOPH_03041 [Tolypocladium ophioglossoides CBS 100239]
MACTTTTTAAAAACAPAEREKASSSSGSPPTDKPRWSSAKNTAASSTPGPIEHIPPPWRLHGDVYCISFWTSGASARSLRDDHAYSPLEAGTDFANPPGSRPVGGLGMIQIIRYRDSPVGPYDELLVVPGSYDWSRDGPDGRPEVGRNPRISRIYVSQKHTCFNGRINWNCPKHLARFDWDFGPNDSVSVKVYPHDTTGDVTESAPSTVPWFQASFSPISYAPSFPFATRWVNYLGFDTTLVMPPLPRGKGSQGELPSTKNWCSIVPMQYSRTTRVGWFDLAQRDDTGKVVGVHENFWPGLGRWQLGLKMENADLSFDLPKDTWPAPRSKANL